MEVRADVDALGAEARLGDRGVGRLEVRGRDLVAGALGGPKQPPQPAGRPLGEVAIERATPRALLKRDRALIGAQLATLAKAAHRSPRQSGRP